MKFAKQVDQGDIDRGEAINRATVECANPQDLPVTATATGKVLLKRTYGIVIGEFKVLTVNVLKYCTFRLERNMWGALVRASFNLSVSGASTLE